MGEPATAADSRRKRILSAIRRRGEAFVSERLSLGVVHAKALQISRKVDARIAGIAWRT
jgi:hypothetical protein